MRTINHPDHPEQLYYLDEQAQTLLEVKQEKKFTLVQMIIGIFTTPTVDCTNCGKEMTKKWINQWGGPREDLFLVCEDCHRFVDCRASRD